MSEEQGPLDLHEELKGLETKLDELAIRAAQIRTKKTNQFQRIKELAVAPEISGNIAKILPNFAQAKSMTVVTNVCKEAKNIISLLEMILLSPHVEELLAAVAKLMATLSLEFPLAIKNWMRNACKDATEQMLNNLTETTRKIEENLNNLRLFKHQFKEWLSYQLSQLTGLKETHTSIDSWMNEVSSGAEKIANLSCILAQEIKKNASEFKNIVELIDFFNEISVKKVTEGFSTRIKDAPTYWSENASDINKTWQSATPRLASLNSLVEKLSEKEKELLWKHLNAHKDIRLSELDNFLDSLSKSVFSLVDSKKSVEMIKSHIDSTKDVEILEPHLGKLLNALKQLERETPNVAHEKAFQPYVKALQTFSEKYGNWKKELGQVILSLRKEAESWKQLCNRQGLTAFEAQISKLMDSLSEGITIGASALVHHNLSTLFKDIKEELGKRGDPELLETIIRLQSSIGTVTLTDIEEELRKVEPSIKKGEILLRVANLETNKLIRVEVKA
jgi:hypothetical protein